jgi:hypothetical protein
MPFDSVNTDMVWCLYEYAHDLSDGW